MRLFSQFQVGDQPRGLPVDAWKKEMWYIYRVEYYSGTKKEAGSFPGKYMEPEITVLSDISQTEKLKYCVFSLKCRI